MLQSEIKNICIEGSKSYYDFLSKKPNGGVEEVSIRKIEQISDNTFSLKIDKKLFDPDTVCFLYNGKFKRFYTGDSIAIKIYDNDQRVIIVKVSDEVIPIISDLVFSNWKIIIDLKFLVQRVIDWYELNGNRLKFNLGKRKDSQFDSSVIPKGEDNNPSEEQNEALNTIFSEKFSYIWGAPGTGKTRFVLSYSILHYIKKNVKVLVLAPTNVALEQIFQGIIEVTDLAKVKRSKLLRLGYPSKEFADKYGEVCEIQGLEKELKRVNNQIDIISSILGIKSEREAELENNIKIVNNSLYLKNELSIRVKKEEELQKNIQLLQAKLKVENSQLLNIRAEIDALIQKKNSIFNKIFSSFSKKVDYDLEIFKKSRREKELAFNIEKIEKNISDLSSEIVSLVEEKKNLDNVYRQSLESLMFLNNGNIIEHNDLLNKLNIELNRELERHIEYKPLVKDYEKYSESQLTDFLKQLKNEKDKLENYSIDKRIENSQVIGATLDTFLHRFKEKTLNVAHIFLDEAGYASIVKALTIFTENIPITFLGDHKQLPPVCELSKGEIQQEEKYSDIFVWDQSAIFIGELWKSTNKVEALKKYLALQEPSRDSIPRASLTYSYRFGPNLAKTLEKYVYSDGFRSRKESNTEIVIYDTINPIEARVKGRLNEAEAVCIKSYVNDNFSFQDSIAILSPYRDQVKRLEQLLPQYKDENKILTVHKSQGREWDTVIYSVCDIGNGKKPWFTDSQNTISNGLNNVNTAVSRAKKKLIIFCSKEEWIAQTEQLISGLLQSATKNLKSDITKVILIPQQEKYDNYKKEYSSNKRVENNKEIKGKDYVPILIDEEWESQLLFWSKKKKEGYTYSSKKEAWYKKKN